MDSIILTAPAVSLNLMDSTFASEPIKLPPLPGDDQPGPMKLEPLAGSSGADRALAAPVPAASSGAAQLKQLAAEAFAARILLIHHQQLPSKNPRFFTAFGRANFENQRS